MGAFLVNYAPLAHIDHSRTNPIIESYEAKLDLELEAIENDISANRIRYDNKEIKAEQYFINFDHLQELKSKTEKQNNLLYKNKVDEERIFGWKTLRIFLVGFGIRIPYLFYAIIISFLVYKIKTKDTYLKLSLSFLQVACYTQAIYQSVWPFWKLTDYPLDAYRAMLLFGSLLVSITAVYFIMYHARRKRNLLHTISNLKNDFLDFILEVRNTHYKPLLKKAMKKDLFNEAYQEELKTHTKKVQNRLHDKANEILQETAD